MQWENTRLSGSWQAPDITVGVIPTVGAAVGSGKDRPVVFLLHLHHKLDFQPLFPWLLNLKSTAYFAADRSREMGKGVFPYCAFKLMSKG